MVDWNPLGHQFIYPHQPPAPPFNNPKIRQAALLCIEQEEYLKATVGEPEYYKVCSSAAFICGTPNAFDAPDGLFVKPNYEKAKALLKEAGYDGTPIVLMQSTDAAGADQHRAGHQVAAREGRLQGRHAVDGLADAGDPPHQEGSAGHRAAGTSSTPSSWRPTS